ncbi:hypothetical protein BGZ76_009854 [Entomortierella beljakovae]|nr:hypothetical protein BGZ76_009854 [Entomortierella beljakovae]
MSGNKPRERSPPYWPGARSKAPQQRMAPAAATATPAIGGPSARRDNVIMGTDDDAIIRSYVRTAALDTLVERFMKSTGSTSEGHTSSDLLPIKKQIVSLGCGSDTRYFNLKRNGLSVHKYFEIDFQESTSKKAFTIKKNKVFTDIVSDPNMKVGLGGMEIYANDYCLLSGDLREFEESIVPKMKANGFDTRDSDSIVEWVGANMSASLFVVYEQINPTDAFGSMMLKNLRAREIELPGIYAYPTLKSQEERFLSRGWTAAKAVSMNTLLDSLPDEEMKRISKLEIFDEVEEWQLLAEHYCVAWAYMTKKTLSSSGNDKEQANFIRLLSSSVDTTKNPLC